MCGTTYLHRGSLTGLVEGPGYWVDCSFAQWVGGDLGVVAGAVGREIL